MDGVDRPLAIIEKMRGEVPVEGHHVLIEVRQAILMRGPIVQLVLDILANKAVLGREHTKTLLLLVMSLEAQMHGQADRSDHFLGQAEAAIA